MPGRTSKITVLTVSRRVQFLSRCVGSVRGQSCTGPVRHLFVVDDNPAAESELASLGIPDEDVVAVPREPSDRTGPARLATLRNLAVRSAGGGWLVFLDDDNAWEPDHLESLWDAVEASGADLAHSQRMMFGADGSPYLRPEFPWGRDELTRRAVYAYCLEAGIMSRGSNVMRDRLEMRFTWVDLGEWLFCPGFLEANSFTAEYGAWEWFNVSVEDRDLPMAVFNSGLKVVATGRPTLHYFLGGYTNTGASGLVWGNPAGEAMPGWASGR